MSDLTREQAEKITTMLKADVEWILAHRKLKFDPSYGAEWDDEKNEYRTVYPDCGTCLIGAHMLHEQPDPTRDDDGQIDVHEDCIIFARDVRCDYPQAYAIYMGATLAWGQIEYYPRAALVAARVLEHALRKGWDPEESIGDDKESYQNSLNRYIERCELSIEQHAA